MFKLDKFKLAAAVVKTAIAKQAISNPDSPVVQPPVVSSAPTPYNTRSVLDTGSSTASHEPSTDILDQPIRELEHAEPTPAEQAPRSETTLDGIARATMIDTAASRALRLPAAPAVANASRAGNLARGIGRNIRGGLVGPTAPIGNAGMELYDIAQHGYGNAHENRNRFSDDGTMLGYDVPAPLSYLAAAGGAWANPIRSTHSAANSLSEAAFGGGGLQSLPERTRRGNSLDSQIGDSNLRRFNEMRAIVSQGGLQALEPGARIDYPKLLARFGNRI